ncbi:MAG: bifunctional hydroxymethylpyrimidine kinase/phosphomethylpyrimidine kinase [Clostridia bacterium]|nr:bifunctional hydroxymethylpyrimidine kinase/phosphomethylpyrimidine kinase [Clostridia bacterium]MBQ2326779.1 bifunctional hydroxymethylpyrimidine kinase/phosphomethylpyrimidine kinase [Clostridia bacterium]
MVKVLSIAGSDPSGGAGIQADLKTMAAHGAYGMCAITALTVQNTTGVSGVMDVPVDIAAAQIDAVFEDIRPDAVKIGMVSSGALADAIADRLSFHKASNIVVDPVMVATSGSVLMAGGALDVMKKKLFPMAAVITPNIPEAQVLCGFEIHDEADMERAGEYIRGEYGCAVLVKGGHSISDASDLLVYDGGKLWLHGRRIYNSNTHGTGCTLSSAIACRLGEGYSLPEAVRLAKKYISGALSAMLDLGKGSGPLDHMWVLR